MCISDDRFYQCTDLKHLNQALVLLHYYKNSPSISKSWIRACACIRRSWRFAWRSFARLTNRILANIGEFLQEKTVLINRDL